MKVLGIEFKRPHSLETLSVLSLVVLAVVFREQLALITDTKPQDVFGISVATLTGAFLRACGLNIKFTNHLLLIIALSGAMALVARNLI